MNLLCSLFTVFIGIIGIHIQFLAVSILGLGPMKIVDAIFSYGLGLPFLFCLCLILVGSVFSVILVIQKIKNRK